MKIRSAASTAAAIGAIGTLSLSGLALARPGDRTLPETFPRASALCTEATSGQLPRSLRGETAQVAAACTTLGNAYAAAVTTGQAAETTEPAAVSSARMGAQQACPGTGAAGRRACRQARRQARLAIDAARATLRAATATYRASIESARATFWSTIHGLRGGADIPADSPDTNASIPSS